MQSFKEFLIEAGVKQGSHLLLHSSFKNIRNAFPSITIETIINLLKEQLTPAGSLMIPAFTYCFKKSKGEHEIFDQKNSCSKVGAISEVFRNTPGVIRTSSPTHSFSLWGKVTDEITESNSPESPLGKGSVLDWLAKTNNSYILLLGCGFESLSFGHYIEIITPVMWSNISPWYYLNVLNIGISTNGEQVLSEIPGCAKGFLNFQNYLEENKIIEKKFYNSLPYFLLDVSILLKEGIIYFKYNQQKLLCDKGKCAACDVRIMKLKTNLTDI